MKIAMNLALIITMLVMMACGQSKNGNETTTKEVKKEMQEAVDVSKEYASDKVDKINTEINQLMENLNIKMGEIEKKYDAQSDELKDMLKKTKAEIDRLRMELDKKIDEYEQAADDKKEEIKEEIELRKTALEKSIEAFEKTMDKK